jgi:hypothetical protein
MPCLAAAQVAVSKRGVNVASVSKVLVPRDVLHPAMLTITITSGKMDERVESAMASLLLALDELETACLLMMRD